MRSSSIGWTVGFSLLAVVGVDAQQPTPLDLTCHPNQIDRPEAVPTETHWVPRLPTNVTRDVLEYEAQGRWGDAAHYIVELFRPDFQGLGANAVLTAAETFRDAVRADEVKARAAGVAGASGFIVQEVPPAGPTDPSSYATLNQTVFITSSDSMEKQRTVCWLAHSLRRFHDRLDAPGRYQSEAELRARVERWDLFNDRGLTPYPWELVLNEAVGWFGSRSALEPPQVQMIALRPSVAVELEWDFDNRTNVAAVEVFGVITYVNARRWYLGASLLWTSPTGSSTGWGALVHVAPWLKGGPVWRDFDGDGDREKTWTLSIDAFDLFKGAPQSLLEAAQEATGGRAMR